MISILIATHGGLADGLASAVELLAGKQEKFETIGLYHGDGIDEFAQNIQNKCRELDDGDGVLVFIDLFGGSPSNAVMKLMGENAKLQAVAGVNLPMVIQAVFMREECSLEQLNSLCIKSGAEALLSLSEKYQHIIEEAKNQEDDF